MNASRPLSRALHSTLPVVACAMLSASCVYRSEALSIPLAPGDVTVVLRGTLPGSTTESAIQGARGRVAPGSTSASSRADGRLVLRNLPEGTHRVLLAHDVDGDGEADLAAQAVAVIRTPAGRNTRPGVDLGTVVLARAGTVTGTVAAPSGVAVDLQEVVVAVLGTEVRVRADAQGRFTIPGLGAGTWDIVAAWQGYASAVTAVVINAGDTTQVATPLLLQPLPVPEGSVAFTLASPEPGTATNSTGSLAQPLVVTIRVQALPLVPGEAPPPPVELSLDLDGEDVRQLSLPPGLYDLLFSFGDDAGVLAVTVTGVLVQSGQLLDLGVIAAQRLASLLEGNCVDLDQDQACELTDENTSCRAECLERPRDQLARPCTAEGRALDCDDDGDGQADPAESMCQCALASSLPAPRGCAQDPTRSDRDFDGRCDLVDPFPDCALNTPGCMAPPDAGVPDAAVTPDAAMMPDAAMPPDAGPPMDAGTPPDAAVLDAAVPDAAIPDAAVPDAFVPPPDEPHVVSSLGLDVDLGDGGVAPWLNGFVNVIDAVPVSNGNVRVALQTSLLMGTDPVTAGGSCPPFNVEGGNAFVLQERDAAGACVRNLVFRTAEVTSDLTIRGLLDVPTAADEIWIVVQRTAGGTFTPAPIAVNGVQLSGPNLGSTDVAVLHLRLGSNVTVLSWTTFTPPPVVLLGTRTDPALVPLPSGEMVLSMTVDSSNPILAAWQGGGSLSLPTEPGFEGAYNLVVAMAADGSTRLLAAFNGVAAVEREGVYTNTPRPMPVAFDGVTLWMAGAWTGNELVHADMLPFTPRPQDAALALVGILPGTPTADPVVVTPPVTRPFNIEGMGPGTPHVSRMTALGEGRVRLWMTVGTYDYMFFPVLDDPLVFPGGHRVEDTGVQRVLVMDVSTTPAIDSTVVLGSNQDRSANADMSFSVGGVADPAGQAMGAGRFFQRLAWGSLERAGGDVALGSGASPPPSDVALWVGSLAPDNPVAVTAQPTGTSITTQPSDILRLLNLSDGSRLAVGTLRDTYTFGAPLPCSQLGLPSSQVSPTLGPRSPANALPFAWRIPARSLHPLNACTTPAAVANPTGDSTMGMPDVQMYSPPTPVSVDVELFPVGDRDCVTFTPTVSTTFRVRAEQVGASCTGASLVLMDASTTSSVDIQPCPTLDQGNISTDPFTVCVDALDGLPVTVRLTAGPIP